MAQLPVGTELEDDLETMWTESSEAIAAIDPSKENWKIQTLPLARIKKIMKNEEFILQELEKEKRIQAAKEEGEDPPTEDEKSNVKFMISGEAPVLMGKACELLIQDISFRAWRHTERNRRRTLQRQDVHAAVGESEVYDFLIDIVPRVTSKAPSAMSGPADLPLPGMVQMPTMTQQPIPHIPQEQMDVQQQQFFLAFQQQQAAAQQQAVTTQQQQVVQQPPPQQPQMIQHQQQQAVMQQIPQQQQQHLVQQVQVQPQQMVPQQQQQLPTLDPQWGAMPMQPQAPQQQQLPLGSAATRPSGDMQ